MIARQPSTRHWRVIDVVLLSGVLLIATGLRCHLMRRSPTYDELWHLALSTARGSPVGQIEPDRLYVDPPDMASLADAPPFWEVWNHMDGVLHPPLYVTTLRLWRDLFGGSDTAAMAYSVAWSLVAIAAVFATVRLLADRYAAALLALAMTFARTQSYVALQIRGYEMLVGLAAVSLWLMVRMEIFGPTRRRAVLLAAMTLPLLLTHYFAAGAVAAIAVYGLSRARGCRLAFATALAGSGLVYVAIWLPFAIRQLDAIHTGDAFLRLDHFSVGPEAVAIGGAPFRLVVDAAQTSMLAAVVGLVGMIVVIAMFSARKRAGDALPSVLWLLGTLGFIAALDAIRVTQHAFFIRYLAVATPAAFVIIASMGTFVGQWGARVAAGLLLAVAIAVRPEGPIVSETAPDYSSTARWLAANVPADEPILLCHGASSPEVGDMLFLHVTHEPGSASRSIMKVERPFTPATVERLPRRAWVVIPYPVNGLLTKMFQDPLVIEQHAMPEGAGGEMYHVEWPR